LRKGLRIINLLTTKRRIKMPMTVVTKKKDGKECTVEFDFGDNCADAAAKFGEDIVFAYFKSHGVVRLQAGLAPILKAGGDIAAFAKTWKPGVRVAAVAAAPTMESMRKHYASLSTDEERKEFLKEVKSGIK